MNSKTKVAVDLIRSCFSVSLAGISIFFVIVCTLMLMYSINADFKGIVMLAVLPVIFAFGTLYSYSLLKNVRAYDLFKDTGLGPWVRLTGFGLMMWGVADIASHLTIGNSVAIPGPHYDPKKAALSDLSIFCALMAIIGWTFIPRIVLEKNDLKDALIHSHRELRGQPLLFHAIVPVLCFLAITLSPAILVLSLIFLFPFATKCYLSNC